MPPREEPPINVSFGLPLPQAQPQIPMGLAGLPTGGAPGSLAPLPDVPGYTTGQRIVHGLEGFFSGLAGQPDPAIERRKALQAQQAMAMQQQEMGLRQQAAVLAERKFGLDALTKLMPIGQNLAAAGGDEATLRQFMGLVSEFGSRSGVMPKISEAVIDTWLKDRDALKGMFSGEIERLTKSPEEAQRALRMAATKPDAYKAWRNETALRRGVEQATAEIAAGGNSIQAWEKAKAAYPFVAQELDRAAGDPGKYVEYRILPTGQRAVYDKRSGKEEVLGEPLKTAQPLTRPYLASVASGALTDATLSPEQARQALTELEASEGRTTGQRTEQRIGTEFENREKLVELKKLQEGARKQVGLDYLEPEVRIRAQTALNVATNPENVALAAAKIRAEEEARQAGRPLNETTQQAIGLLQTTRAALEELKSRFTPEQRRQYVGIFTNPVLRAAQVLKGDKGFAEFQALMGRIKKAAFDDGGKQLTPFEFSVVAQYIPQGNEASWQDFEAKLAVATDYSDMLIKARTTLGITPKGKIAEKGLPQPEMSPGRVPAPGKPPPRILSIQPVQ